MSSVLGDIPVIRVFTGLLSGAILNEILPAEFPESSAWTTKTEFRFEVYCPDVERRASTRSDICRLLDQMAELLPETVHVEETIIKREDWSEVWKKHFHPLKVSQRISIRPSWEELPFPPTESVIVIDPGMSFGTGRHGTTSACLQFIDKFADRFPGASFLDIGCGSGILTIAAIQLGLTGVCLFDYDVEAVKCAKENLELNGILNTKPVVCDIAEFTCERPFKIVVANLESSILRPNVEQISACVDQPDGQLVLSGILDCEFEDVASLFTEQRFLLQDSVRIDEWRTGHFVAK